MERLNFQLDLVLKAIREKNPKRVLLQFPEGLKKNAFEIVDEFKKRKTDVEFIISGDSCWGGCDLAIEEAKKLGADLIVHFGHSKFTKTDDISVVYVNVKDNVDLMPLIRESLKNLEEFQKIAMVSSVQHIHEIQMIKEFYSRKGKVVEIPQAVGNVSFDGQIIGCEYSGLKQIKDKIEAVVVIGNKFHALGAALALPNKPVFLIDSYNNIVENMSELRNKVIRQRNNAIEAIKSSVRIGIIVGLKPGQRFGSPEALQEELDAQGKLSLIVTMNEISNEKLMNFYNIDGFIELACPRVSIDDYSRFEKPVINYKEALVVIGKLTWDDLLENGFV